MRSDDGNRSAHFSERVCGKSRTPCVHPTRGGMASQRDRKWASDPSPRDRALTSEDSSRMEDARRGEGSRLTFRNIVVSLSLFLSVSLSLSFSLPLCLLRLPRLFGVIIINARPGPGSERIYGPYTGIQYLNARSNTGDKRELRRYRAACNDRGV